MSVGNALTACCRAAGSVTKHRDCILIVVQIEHCRDVRFGMNLGPGSRIGEYGHMCLADLRVHFESGQQFTA